MLFVTHAFVIFTALTSALPLSKRADNEFNAGQQAAAKQLTQDGADAQDQAAAVQENGAGRQRKSGVVGGGKTGDSAMLGLYNENWHDLRTTCDQFKGMSESDWQAGGALDNQQSTNCINQLRTSVGDQNAWTRNRNGCPDTKTCDDQEQHPGATTLTGQQNTGTRQQSTSNGQQSTGNGQQTTSTGQQNTSNNQQNTGTGQQNISGGTGTQSTGGQETPEEQQQREQQQQAQTQADQQQREQAQQAQTQAEQQQREQAQHGGGGQSSTQQGNTYQNNTQQSGTQRYGKHQMNPTTTTTNYADTTDQQGTGTGGQASPSPSPAAAAQQAPSGQQAASGQQQSSQGSESGGSTLTGGNDYVDSIKQCADQYQANGDNGAECSNDVAAQ